VSTDRQVRKQWLLSFWLYYGLPLVFSWLFSLLIAFGILTVGALSGNLGIGVLLVLALLFSLGFSLIPMGITYYCAYKKRGTKWLLFLLILIPIKILFVVPGASLGNAFTVVPVNGMLYSIFVTPLWALLHVYFWVTCYRLRKANKR